MENKYIYDYTRKVFPSLQIETISKMNSLSQNEVFLIKLSNGKKIVLKKYPYKYEARFNGEIEILKELESVDIPSPMIIDFDAKNLMLIEEFMQGQLLLGEMGGESFDSNIMKDIGWKLAKLHKVSASEVWQDKNKINTKEDWLVFTEARNNSNLKDLEVNGLVSAEQLSMISGYLKKFIKVLGKSSILLCPIHGDYNPMNILIQEGKTSGIFDFEIHRIAHNLNDLGIAYYWYKFYDKGELFAPFIEGYSSEIDITGEDNYLIEVYYIMQVIGAISFLHKNKLDKNAIERLKFLLNEFLAKPNVQWV